MKLVCQIVHSEDGTRSKAFVMEMAKFCDELKDNAELDSHYLLVLADDVEGELQPSQFPLMTVGQFKSCVGEGYGREEISTAK